MNDARAENFRETGQQIGAEARARTAARDADKAEFDRTKAANPDLTDEQIIFDINSERERSGNPSTKICFSKTCKF